MNVFVFAVSVCVCVCVPVCTPIVIIYVFICKLLNSFWATLLHNERYEEPTKLCVHKYKKKINSLMPTTRCDDDGGGDGDAAAAAT